MSRRRGWSLRAARGWFLRPPDGEGVGDGGQGVSRGRLRWLRVLLVAAAAAMVLSVILVFVVIPYPWTLGSRNPHRTALMEQRIREARLVGDTLLIRQEWLPLPEISPNLVRAVIVAEDYRFREHEGVDWVSLAEEVEWTGDDEFKWRSPSDLAALVRALRYVRSHQDELRGRSTLTQQLAKNLYFGTERSFLRKALELVVARRLERRLGKDRILELYLNLVEWGPGIFGAEAAAQRYFGTSARELTIAQAAALAGTLPHPLTSNPAHNPGQMRWRQEMILDRLVPGREPPPEVPQPDTARVDSPGRSRRGR
ncbi:MAG: transglycosylase domain-containing protein [Gemmatimonadales bacterium]|nr:MAG: transglycosylase domain-containing protein [Gemmatimonadales bacterium]